MNLAIFDLDNTLLAGDSDHAWGEFIVEQGLVDGNAFAKANDQFYEDYKRGELDINAYLRFALQPLKAFSLDQLAELHRTFMDQKIRPIKLAKAQALVNKHKEQGDVLLVITATNRFITSPIVESFGIEHLLASDAEIIDQRYTGEPAGIPCYAEGKVKRLADWLETQAPEVSTLKRWFYSDSRNDIPLLEHVDTPIAVDPDPVLREVATERNWDILSLR